jgi:hypothetical protein
MKQVHVYFEKRIGPADGMTVITEYLRKAEKHPLDFTPWAAYPYKPDVRFSIVHNNSNIFLQYQVEEAHLRAACGRTNDPVYQDSCVEFFISFDDGASYYNFEFNCIGTVLAGFGKSRTERSWLPEEVLGKLACQALIQKGSGERKATWELTVVLPLDVFVFHSFSSLEGKEYRANFYKCGDNLPEPHFVAWSNIQSESPDFHLPQFFGTLLFE